MPEQVTEDAQEMENMLSELRALRGEVEELKSSEDAAGTEADCRHTAQKQSWEHPGKTRTLKHRKHASSGPVGATESTQKNIAPENITLDKYVWAEIFGATQFNLRPNKHEKVHVFLMVKCCVRFCSQL